MSLEPSLTPKVAAMPQVRLLGPGAKAAESGTTAVLSAKSSILSLGPAKSGIAAARSGNQSATVIAIASQRAGQSEFTSPGDEARAPAAGAHAVKACQWCGKRITRWRLLAYLREPPLCSRKCIMAWFNREL
jgi:hypothetical protein